MAKIRYTHDCLGFMLVFAQCFGMLPVSGIKKSYTDLRFSWTSKRTLYSLTFIILAVINILLQVLNMIRMGNVDFGQCVTLLFLLVSALTVAIFLDVARKWPDLMKKWSEVDKTLADYGFPANLERKLKIIAVIVMTAAIVEHSLFMAFTIKYAEIKDDFFETVQVYLEHRFYQVFDIFPYCIPLALIVQILNTSNTVSWNFMDLFIMIISLSLSARFKQVVKRVGALAKKKENSEYAWKTVREDFTKLVNLCSVVDDTISTIILVSFGNNIFVVLVQLYFSLQRPPSNGILDKIYYVYSFALIIIRTCAVALFAATINLETKKPQYYLNVLTNNVYNTEIERFLYQTKYSNVALTGHKLFKVTKSLILSIAGAIVSYELVLIQFNVAD